MSPRKATGQAERTRVRLLEAAREAFAQRGYAAARVDDIVKRAGTSHGTFYLYFQNKEDVLLALARQTAEEGTALARAFAGVVAAEDRFEALRRWVEAFFELNRRDWPVLQAWIQAESGSLELRDLGRRVLAAVARELARAIAQVPGRQGLDPAVAATALVAMIERFSYYWQVRGARFEHRAAVDTVAHLLAGAVFGQDVAARPRMRVRGSRG